MASRRCRCSPRHEWPPTSWIGWKSSSVDRDQLTEHLKFAAELGVAGVSRDPAWRTRPGPTHGSAPAMTPDDAGTMRDDVGADQRVRSATIQVARNAAEALAAVRADIGDCTRC